MNFDDCQALWQKQPLPTPAGADADTLEATIRRVRADARSFDRKILWSDLREIIAALVATVLFADVARTQALAGAPTWNLVLVWLAVALPLGVAGFLLADRLRARRRRFQGTATVLSEIDHALARLRHQHRLLMSVAWWYLLPLATSAALVMVHPITVASTSGSARLALAALAATFLAAVNYPIWWINRRAAVKVLAPRIEQLERERQDFSAAVPPDTDSSTSLDRRPPA